MNTKLDAEIIMSLVSEINETKSYEDKMKLIDSLRSSRLRHIFAAMKIANNSDVVSSIVTPIAKYLQSLKNYKDFLEKMGYKDYREGKEQAYKEKQRCDAIVNEEDHFKKEMESVNRNWH